MIELKDEVDKPTITPETLVVGVATQKISKHTEELKTTDHQNRTDIHRTCHSAREEYAQVVSAHGTYAKVSHILGHKTNFNKFRTGTVQSMFFNHKGIRLETIIRKVTEKSPNT